MTFDIEDARRQAADARQALSAIPAAWTIDVITEWDGEEGDELFKAVATVFACGEHEALAKYGEAHPYDRDYNFVYARRVGEPWGAA